MNTHSPVTPGGQPDNVPAARPVSEDNTLAIITCLMPLFVVLGGMSVLAFVPPFIVWRMQRDKDPFTAEVAREVFNFQFSLMLYLIAAFALIFGFAVFSVAQVMAAETLEPPAFPGLLVLLVVLVAFGTFLLELFVCLRGAIAASDGRIFHAPLNLRLF